LFEKVRLNFACLDYRNLELNHRDAGFHHLSETGRRDPGGTKTLRLDIPLAEAQLNTLGDGREFYTDIRGVHSWPSGPTPRTPDGNRLYGSLACRQGCRSRRGDLRGEAGPRCLGQQPIAKERTEGNGKDSPGVRCLPNNVQPMSATWVQQVVQTPCAAADFQRG